MKRGELWTVAAARTYASKPRPVVILQDDRFDTDSITVCPLTRDATPAPLLRVPIEPSADNGLRDKSFIMVDKISTIRRTRMGRRVGRLVASEPTTLERHVLTFLGFAGGSR